MAKEKDFYLKVKIAGMISFIPFILIAGPLGLFFTGDYLKKKFNLPEYFIYIFIGLGFIAAINETIRIIKKVISITSKN